MGFFSSNIQDKDQKNDAYGYLKKDIGVKKFKLSLISTKSY